MNMQPLYRLSKNAVRTLLHQGGGLHDVRFWNRNSFRILMYHDFPADAPRLMENLAQQCSHIARHYDVMTMTEISQMLQDEKPLPPNALAVTVDDGNRDFLVNGYPVFRAYKIPVTVYLVTDFLDQKLSLWWDEIHLLMSNSRKLSVEISLAASQPPVTFALATDGQRQRAMTAISRVAKTLGSDGLKQLLQNLSDALESAPPDPDAPPMRPLAWDEVRTLAQNGVEFGAHTVTHPMLSRVGDRAMLIGEIAGSKDRIEHQIGRPVRHFCYPYGGREDVNEEALSVVKESGFHTAVVAEPGLNVAGDNPFRLKRVAVDASSEKFYFEESLAGLHSGSVL